MTGILYVNEPGMVKGKINYANLIVDKGGVLKGTLKNIDTEKPIASTAE